LGGGGQGADDDFGIDGVCGEDFAGVGLADEAEVFGVLEVVVVRGGVDGVAEEEGLYDAADAGFLESFEEVVEVDGAVLDEALDGLVDVVEGDGDAVIAVEALFDDFACDGIDEPGLSERLLVDVVDGVFLEDLSGFGGVLCVEGGDFVTGEVLEGHGLGDDVEGAEAAEGLVFGADEAAVVTDVTEADEGDGVGKGETGGTVDISVAELCDEGDEEGGAESVGFVEEEDEGAVEAAAVAGEGALEDVSVVVEIGVLEEGLPMWEIGVFEGTVDGTEKGEDAVLGVGEFFGVFEGTVEGVVTAAGVEPVGEVLDAGGFAGLAGGVDEEVLLAVDEALEFGEAGDGGEDVVVPRVAGAGDVEEACHNEGVFLGVYMFSRAKVRKRGVSFSREY
jgi:hypothetical protein